jgi:hypothetical protein
MKSIPARLTQAEETLLNTLKTLKGYHSGETFTTAFLDSLDKAVMDLNRESGKSFPLTTEQAIKKPSKPDSSKPKPEYGRKMKFGV